MQVKKNPAECGSCSLTHNFATCNKVRGRNGGTCGPKITPEYADLIGIKIAAIPAKMLADANPVYLREWAKAVPK